MMWLLGRKRWTPNEPDVAEDDALQSRWMLEQEPADWAASGIVLALLFVCIVLFAVLRVG